MKRMKMLSVFQAMLGSISAVIALTGCLQKPSEPVVKQQPAEPVKTTLKVAFYNQDQFKRNYGDILKKMMPDIEFQVIPTIQSTNNSIGITIELAKLLEQKPDLIVGYQLRELSSSGKAMELSPLIKQDGFDLNAFTDLALEQLRIMGDGKLIGLSPVFNSTATFYNKELFDRFGVAYPTNNMSWQSMMELAKKFARNENGKQYYGIFTNHLPFSLTQTYIRGIGADYLSADRKKALYNSNSYRLAMEAAVDAFKAGVIYLPPEKSEPADRKNTILKNKFVAGEAAMAFHTPSLIDTIKLAEVEGIPTVKWDVVTEPVDPNRPNISSFGASVQDTFAIYADSPHKNAAWNVIKTVMSKEMAAELAKTKSSQLSTRKDSVLTVEGRRLDAFYAHKTEMSTTSSGTAWSSQLAQQSAIISSEEITNMIYDRKSVADGLSAMQARTQQAIDEEFAAKK